jgi:hypothetical protein
MKKLFLPAFVIFILQLVVGWVCLKVIVGKIESAGIGFGGFSGHTSLWPLGLIAFIAIPIIGGKWIADASKQPISWKKTASIYLGVIGLMIVLSILWSIVHSSRY